MEAHAIHVWKKYVINSKFKKLFVVAHSAGGACLSSIQTSKEFSISILPVHQSIGDLFYERVEKLALTDSWTVSLSALKEKEKTWMWERA